MEEFFTLEEADAVNCAHLLPIKDVRDEQGNLLIPKGEHAYVGGIHALDASSALVGIEFSGILELDENYRDTGRFKFLPKLFLVNKTFLQEHFRVRKVQP